MKNVSIMLPLLSSLKSN